MRHVKQFVAGGMAFVMLTGNSMMNPAFAETVSNVIAAPVRLKTVHTPSDATPGNIGGETEDDEFLGDEELVNDLETATDSNLVLDEALLEVPMLLAEAGDGTGVYELQAEDSAYAVSENANLNGTDQDRMELQQGGSVTFDLSKVTDFEDGTYLVSVNMNGSTKAVSLSVNGKVQGTIRKAGAEWWQEDLRQYDYHGLVELKAGDSVKIQEADNSYGHLDWMKLERIDETLTADAFDWFEAEDEAVAEGIRQSTEGDFGVHGDGNRFQLAGGDGIKFTLADIAPGTYQLYVGANGARKSLDVAVNDAAEPVGTIGLSGDGDFRVCEAYGFDELLSLQPGDTITLTDASGTWGHVDYIRLVRTGESEILPDETFLKYEAETYYTTKHANEGKAADLQPGDSFEIPVRDAAGFSDGTYKLSVNANGNRTKLMVKVNGEPVGMLDRSGTGFGETDLNEAEFEPVLELGGDDRIAIYAPGTKDQGPYGWVDYAILTRTDEIPAEFPESQETIRLEAEDFWPDSLEADGQVANVNHPDKCLEIPILQADGFAAEEQPYLFAMKTTGTMRAYEVRVNGDTVLTGTRNGSGYGLEYMTQEIGDAPIILKAGDILTVQFPQQETDNFGNWVDDIELSLAKPFEDTRNHVTVKAEAGVIPAEAVLRAEPASAEQLDMIREQLGLETGSETGMSFFDISLMLGDSKIQPSGMVEVWLPVPDGFDCQTMTLYYMADNGRMEKMPFTESADGNYTVFETNHFSCYGLVNQNVEEGYYYTAADYYDRTTGTDGRMADLQPGDEITIPVSDITEGNYTLSVRSNGSRTRLAVKVNGVPVGMFSRESTGFDEITDMTVDELELVLQLKPEDIITLYAPGAEDLGPYGWVDYISLKETGREPEQVPEPKTKITLEAEDFWPDSLEADGQVANVNNPDKKLEFLILERDGFKEADYLMQLYTTGTMRSYKVFVNGTEVLSGMRDGSGYGMEYMTKLTGTELIHLKPGDILAVQFPQQDTDNYGNWVDRIVLNSNRRADGSLEDRWGGRIRKEEAAKLQKNQGAATSVEDGKLIYQGEAYYTKQKDNPAADLQPGEQILIPVNDHAAFADGTYRLMIRSCGNRESFTIRVNGMKQGGISRKETGYGMDSMTDDGMGMPISLKKGDILAIEGQTGGKYGWIDYVSLTPESRMAQTSGNESCTLEAENYYTKQKDNPAADLQPGTELVIPLDSAAAFTEGSYYIAALSNGNRTVLDISVNGQILGSITRNPTNFTMDSMTLEVLQRPIHLKSGDTISLTAPGGSEAADSMYGWVDKVILMPVPAAEAQEREEYRYPAQAYGKASLYLAAADFQPEQSLVVPLSDNREFSEGDYRILVISNGTREQFQVQINGRDAGTIHRKASDYGDNGMSADELQGVFHLKPSDVVTITGQPGDFYGWVSAVVLEPVR